DEGGKCSLHGALRELGLGNNECAERTKPFALSAVVGFSKDVELPLGVLGGRHRAKERCTDADEERRAIVHWSMTATATFLTTHRAFVYPERAQVVVILLHGLEHRVASDIHTREIRAELREEASHLRAVGRKVGFGRWCRK